MKKITIAIDGYAATGKSTLAKRLAKYFNYTYVDTGAMYRAVTLYASQNRGLEGKELSADQRKQYLEGIEIHFQTINQKQHTFLNNEDVEETIRKPEISDRVSAIAAIPEVRDFLVAQQRAMGSEKGIVMDGRDIGTVVFPNAEIKFFLNARPEIRAQRRLMELTSKGVSTSFEKVLANVIKRDELDSSRAVGPLVKADDALLIDVSDLSLDDVFNTLLDTIKQNINQ